MPYSLVKKVVLFSSYSQWIPRFKFLWPRGHKRPQIEKIRPLYYIKYPIVYLKKWAYFCSTANGFRDIKFFGPRGHKRPRIEKNKITLLY